MLWSTKAEALHEFGVVSVSMFARNQWIAVWCVRLVREDTGDKLLHPAGSGVTPQAAIDDLWATHVPDNTYIRVRDQLGASLIRVRWNGKWWIDKEFKDS